jgi:hypothetical protein
MAYLDVWAGGGHHIDGQAQLVDSHRKERPCVVICGARQKAQAIGPRSMALTLK